MLWGPFIMPPAQPGTATAISSPWVRSSLCKGLEARGSAGGTRGKGWGCSHLPLSGQPFSTPFLPVEGAVGGELAGLGGITVDSLVSTSTLHFLPPILPQTVAQPPSFHTFEAAKQPLCHPLSSTWPLSSHPPLTLREKSRHVCCRPV